MVDATSQESPRSQRQTTILEHTHAHAPTPMPGLTPQGPEPQSSDAIFHLQSAAGTLYAPQQASVQMRPMYPMYIPASHSASQSANTFNMSQVPQSMQMHNPAQSAYFSPQHHGGRFDPSLAASRPTFVPTSNVYQQPHTSLSVAGATLPANHAPYPGMMNPLAPQFSAFQHGNFYYPGPATSQIVPSNSSIPDQVPTHGHLHESMYAPTMGSKPFGATYASSAQSTPSLPYGLDTTGQQSVSRGPPRKPRQSGHALWVGNLPPGASVIDLKDHFSREATDDIESVKLISKSNCAFVNYKTQAACIAAMQRFHDSRFYGIRLVCRLRRTSAPSSSSASASATPDSIPDRPGVLRSSDNSQSASSSDGVSGTESTSRVAARYFILKSLTLQDLEASTSTGIWATQAHNEEALNAAYHSADDVYLIFSANKSGEYFGYARMSSAIPAPDLLENELTEHVAAIENASAADQSTVNTRKSSSSSDLTHILPYASRSSVNVEYVGPRSIPTEATQWAPSGRVIDDLARGTIFWEADESDMTAEEQVAEKELLPDNGTGEQEYLGSPATESADSNATSDPPTGSSTKPPPTALRTATPVSAPVQYPIIARSPVDTLHSPELSALTISSSNTQATPTATPQPFIPLPNIVRHARSKPSSSPYPPATLQRNSSNNQSHPSTSTSGDEASSRGNPFRVDWISMRRVPFYRTRGLRNPLNNNREVKIARDGTEVEAGIGGRLLVLFGGGYNVAPARGGVWSGDIPS